MKKISLDKRRVESSRWTGLSASGRGSSLTCFAVIALLLLAGTQAWALDPLLPPGDNFVLDNWYLGLPIDDQGTNIGQSASITAAQLEAGYSNEYFYTDTDGSMVFWAPVNGATTPGSTYPRSELREQIVPGSNSTNWSGYGYHFMSAQCKVLQIPHVDNGEVIIGQIHSQTGLTRPLVKLYYDEGDTYKIRANLKQDADDVGNNNDTKYYFTNTDDLEVGDIINYSIEMDNGWVTVVVNGQTNTHNAFAPGTGWEDERFYFKAGSYCQDGSGFPWEGARVAFYSLTRNHTTAGQPTFIVNTPYGTPNPSIGTNVYLPNDMINASVSGSPVVNGTTQQVVTGWTGTGDVGSGSGNFTSFTITQDSTIDWQWKTQYWLDTEVVLGGVDVSDSWIDSGSNVSVTATPGFGFQFIRWEGDISSPNATVIVPMDSAKSITAICGFARNLTVSSAYGTPSPGVGVTVFASGETVNASSGPPVVNGTTQQVVTGWTGTGNVVPGSGTNTSFTISNHSTLTWQWQTQYWLDTEVAGSGSVNVADSWHDSGSGVIVTATPDAGHHFVSWSGDSTSTNPVLNLTMDAGKSVTANFAADAVLDVPFPEFVGGGVIEFTVPLSDPGLDYQLEYTDSLTPPPAVWTNLGSSVSGNGGDLILTDPGPITSNRFYRITAQ